MFFSLFYYICVYLLSLGGWNPLSRGSLNPFISRGLESIYHEGDGIHLSRGGWNLSLPITIKVVCLSLVHGQVHPTQHNGIKFGSESSKQNKDNIIVGE
jgi:hypothetical protein